MSGQSIGGIIGTVVGSFFGPVGAAIGGAIGGAVGSTFDTLPTQYGPRLDDLRPQTSEYGKPIPLVYGTLGMGGNVIWASDYVEVETKTEQGGKGGPSQTSVTYSYYGNFAVAFAEGPNTIGRMWAGPSKRLIYDGTILEGSGTIRIYEGSEDQLPDPLIESYEGAGNVPAHRGVTYVVFEMFPLAEDGNAIPFITAEVGAKAGAHSQDPVHVSETIGTPSYDAVRAVVDPSTGWIWQVSNEFLTNSFTVRVISDKGQEVVAEMTVPLPPQLTAMSVKGIVAVPALNAVAVLIDPWILDSRAAWVALFSAGAANQDGTVQAAPSLADFKRYGTPPPGVEAPIDPEAIGATESAILIAYTFDSTSPVKLGVFPHGGDGSAFTAIPTGTVIGVPFQILGDDHYIGIAASLGAGGPKFMILDGASHAVLHVLSVNSAVQGKAYDYDPVRQVFITYTDGGHWVSIDAETGTLTTHALTVPPGSDTDPSAATAATTAITYSSRMDRYLVGASSTGSASGTTIYVISPEAGLTEGAYTFEAGGLMLNPLLDPVTNTGAPYVLSFDSNNVKRLSLGGAAVATPMNLGAIVADLSARAGLAAEQIDVSALTDMVDGYAVARQTTVRSAIDALRPAYYFDAVESGAKVKFVKRGGQAVAVIDDNDLDAHQADGQPGDPLLTTRQMEVELPNAMNVNYLLAATDYEKATKLARRLVGASGEEATLDLPLVLSDTKAQEIAEVNLHAPWVQRIKYGPFTLPRKYSALEPTDIITVRGYEMMLEKVTASPGGVLTCEAAATDSSSYTPHVVVSETVPAEKVVYQPGDTVLELM